MWLELPSGWVVLLNVVGIPAAHLGLSWFFTRLPAACFRPSGRWFRRWPLEGPWLYDGLFRVKAWKEALPDAAGWFGGFSKGCIRGRDSEYLRRFVVETCRSEAAHWAQGIAICGFMIWTPSPWAWVLPVYATLSNLPCILLQRRNRRRLEELLGRRRTQKTRGALRSRGS